MTKNNIALEYLFPAEIQSRLFKAKIYTVEDLDELLNSATAKAIQKRAKFRELEAAKAKVRELENEVYNKI